MEGGDIDFANFTLPTLKAFLEALSQNVSGNKRLLVARAIECPKTLGEGSGLVISRSSGQPKKRRKDTFSPSSIPGIFCNCNCGGICTASQF